YRRRSAGEPSEGRTGDPGLREGLGSRCGSGLVESWLCFHDRVGGVDVGFGFEVETGQDSVEPSWEPPVRFADERHGGRQEDHAHDGGVDGDGGGEADAHHLDHWVVAGDETEEDADHDEGGGGDHLGGGAEALDDAVDVGVTSVMFLAYAR